MSDHKKGYYDTDNLSPFSYYADQQQKAAPKTVVGLGTSRLKPAVPTTQVINPQSLTYFSASASLGYDDTAFSFWRPKPMHAGSKKLALELFGRHCASQIVEYAISRHGRHTFRFRDGQAIQLDTATSLGLPAFKNGKATTDLLYGCGNSETFYWRRSSISATHIQAMLAATERFGEPASLDSTKLIGTGKVISAIKSGLDHEKARRRKAIVEILDSVLEEFANLHLNNPSNAKYKLIYRIRAQLLNDNLPTKWLSNVYRIIVPWGENEALPTATINTQPMWVKIAAIIGLQP